MKDKRKTEQSDFQQEAEDSFLVAVDIGSSGVKAMAAEPEEDGSFRILGVETITKYGCIEKGLITNASEVGNLVKRILLLLGNRIGLVGRHIDKAYVSVGGKMMQVCEVSVKRDLISRTTVSKRRLSEMEDECRTKIETRYPQMAVYSVEAVKYICDGEEQDEAPTEMQRVRDIEIIYSVFVGLRENWDKIRGSFDRANLSITQLWPRPESLLWVLTTDEDREAGVAIIDFGAQTTTLSIYQQARFLKNKVMPLGSYHITRDIQSQNISFDMAEQVKTDYGVAAVRLETESKVLSLPSTLPTGERVKLRTDFLAQIIEARLEEIVSPLMDIVNQYQDRLSRVYITGGGAMLAGLLEYVQSMTDVPVEYGSHADWLSRDAEQQFYMPTYSALVGTIANASVYREEHKEEKPLSEPPFRKKFAKKVLELFSDNEELNE